MYSINRKDALALLSRLDFDVLPENEQNALLDLERLFQERKEPIETCLADLNGFDACSVWKGKQDVLELLRNTNSHDIAGLSEEKLNTIVEKITKTVSWLDVKRESDIAGNNELLLDRVISVCETAGWKCEPDEDMDVFVSRNDLDGDEFGLYLVCPDYIDNINESANEFDIANYLEKRLSAKSPAYAGKSPVEMVRQAQKVQCALAELATELNKLRDTEES